MGADGTSNVVLPRHSRAREIQVRPGDVVTALGGEKIGVVGQVREDAYEVRRRKRNLWLSRDDVFWSDEHGLLVAVGIEELAAHAVDPPHAA
jgi:hypothetical protein